jgi:hypothetical protein
MYNVAASMRQIGDTLHNRSCENLKSCRGKVVLVLSELSPCHEDVCWSGGIAPPVLPWALNMSGQLLFLGKVLTVSFGEEAGQAPQLIWTLRKKWKIL